MVLFVALFLVSRIFYHHVFYLKFSIFSNFYICPFNGWSMYICMYLLGFMDKFSMNKNFPTKFSLSFL